MPVNWGATGRSLIVGVPHADDETLSMAWEIAHHACVGPATGAPEGRRVHLVLLSSGATSGALNEINGLTQDPTWWKRPHDPAREGYAPLTPEEFSRSRAEEFIDAAAQLGVPRERVHFGMDLEDPAALPGSISVAYATEVFEYWVDKELAGGREAPGLRTMHWLDGHQDHAHAGEALRELRLSGAPYGDARWAVKPFEAAGIPGAVPYPVPPALAGEVGAMVRCAALAYGAWAPRAGRFGIGMHSTADRFVEGPLAGAPMWYVRNP